MSEFSIARRLRNSLIILLVVLTIIVVYRLVRDSGMLVSVPQIVPASCLVVSGITGAEDITVDAPTGYAYLSADDRRASLGGEPVQGGIYGLDLTRPDSVPQRLTEELPFSFHPHGLYLFRGNPGVQRLFVVNHREDGSETIEIFRISSPGQISHLETISYPELISPNDVVAVGPRRFYVTNDHGYPRGHWMQTLEDYLGLPLAKISYFDGEKGHIVAKTLRYANGINISPDGRYLYVAEVVARKVRRFEIGDRPETLRRDEVLPVGTGADNLEWDSEGYLWTGAHPHLLAFAAHARDEQALSPSQAVRINPESGATDIILSDNGELLSGSSVAAYWQNTLLVGPVFADHILRCSDVNI